MFSSGQLLRLFGWVCILLLANNREEQICRSGDGGCSIGKAGQELEVRQFSQIAERGNRDRETSKGKWPRWVWRRGYLGSWRRCWNLAQTLRICWPPSTPFLPFTPKTPNTLAVTSDPPLRSAASPSTTTSSAPPMPLSRPWIVSRRRLTPSPIAATGWSSSRHMLLNVVSV